MFLKNDDLTEASETCAADIFAFVVSEFLVKIFDSERFSFGGKSDKFQKYSMKNHREGSKSHNQMQEIIKNASKGLRTESPAQME